MKTFIQHCKHIFIKRGVHNAKCIDEEKEKVHTLP
jgi:hypothetical protein